MSEEIVKKERESGFELLRIIAMILIIAHHAVLHGVWISEDYNNSFNLAYKNLYFGWTAQIGNYLFIILSGYFLSQSTFTWRKVFRFWFQVFSISAVIGLIFFLTRTPVIGYTNWDYETLGFNAAAKPMGLKDLLFAFIPNIWGSNWFACTYLVFYLFSPFLKILLDNLDQKKHLAIVILMLSGTVIQMIPYEGFFHPSDLYIFIMCYFTASYIRLYDPKILQNTLINIFIALLILVIYFIPSSICSSIPKVGKLLGLFFNAFWGRYNFPTVLCSFMIFCCFRKIHIPYNRFINTIAGTTFGIYLIHENSVLKHYVWHKIFKMDSYTGTADFIWYLPVAIIGVFVGCSIIEYVRQLLIERPLLKKIG